MNIQQLIDKIAHFISTLNPYYVDIAVKVAMGLAIIAGVLAFNSLRKSEEMFKKYQEAKDKNTENIIKSMKSSKIKSLNYEAMSSWMQSSGFNYMTGGKISVVGYLTIRVALTFFALLVGFSFNLTAGFIGAFIGWYAIDFIVNQSDDSDNKNMLEDIKTIYDTIRIQVKAGVYITQVLTDCYLVVSNKRLKQALLELTSDLVAKNDVKDALEDFRNKFRNEYVNTLVTVIDQSMQTGQSVKMFDDIRTQIEDIDMAMMMAEQNKIKSMITIVQFLVYGAVILLAIYVAMIGLSNGLKF